MTETLQPRLTGWADEPIVEEPIACSLILKPKNGHGERPCGNIATQDAIVTCAQGHERVQHYCERCFGVAAGGTLPCKVCLSEGKEKAECPVVVITVYPRSEPHE